MTRLWLLAVLSGAFGATVGAASAAAAQGLPDPMRPPLSAVRAAAVPREPAPVLSAVMTFSDKRSAIFNGRLVHDGTAIGAYTIEAVLADGVRYRHFGQTRELHLAHPSNPLKTPVVAVARAAGEDP